MDASHAHGMIYTTSYDSGGLRSQTVSDPRENRQGKALGKLTVSSACFSHQTLKDPNTCSRKYLNHLKPQIIDSNPYASICEHL